MNSEGGLLVVGAAYNGEILGLDKDFEALGKRKSWDEWMQHFINLFNEYIGKEWCSHKLITLKAVAKIKCTIIHNPFYYIQ